VSPDQGGGLRAEQMAMTKIVNRNKPLIEIAATSRKQSVDEFLLATQTPFQIHFFFASALGHTKVPGPNPKPLASRNFSVRF